MAVITDHTQQRWVGLGDLSAACITIPDTCGPEGATLAFYTTLQPDSISVPRTTSTCCKYINYTNEAKAKAKELFSIEL